MAVGLKSPTSLLPVAGIRVANTAAGIRYTGRSDLVLFELAPTSQTAAVFTRNVFCAAPVTVTRRHLAQARPRYLLINSGNANAGTGDAGIKDALACCRSVAELGHCRVEAVLPFSTGVIGEHLAVDKIIQAIPRLNSKLKADGWLGAAQAIMTTDTVVKGISRNLTLDGRGVNITGVAKGAGMIRPDMATMLAFIATDARVSAQVLDCVLSRTVEVSFNAITVDGDTSPNDACVLISTGSCDAEIQQFQSKDYQKFFEAVLEVMNHLAQSIVRDGEGATKFVTIVVNGAINQHEACSVAYCLAHSPLVKTAFYAGDPNWGRMLAAVGRAGIDQLNISDVEIRLNDITVFRQGAVANSYTESLGQRIMSKPEFTVNIDLHRGKHAARIWTTDLSHEYVRINAEYRT